MAMKIFELVGSIMVDNDKANKSISKTDEKAQSVGKTLMNGIGHAAKWGAGIVAGAAAAVAGVTKLATSTAETTDHIDKMSQKIGISAKSYQEWDYILSQNGMSVDSLQGGMKTLTKQMTAAQSGSKSSVEAFKQLGVSITNADGSMRSQEEVMNDTIAALQGVENATDRASMASKMFGKAGGEMAPLLNQTAKSTEELRKKANDLGLVMSDDAISAGVSLTDSMDTLKRSFTAVKNNLGAALMPIVQKFADFIISNMPKIQALIQKLAPIFTMLMDKLLPPLIQLSEQIFPIIIDLIEKLLPPVISIVEKILPIIIELIQQLLPFILQVVEMVLPLLVDLINALLPILDSLMPLLKPILDLTLALLDPLIKLLNMILPPLITVLNAVIKVVVNTVKPIIEWLAKFFKATLNPAIEAIKKVIGPVKDAFVAAWNGIKSAWSGAKDWFGNLWGGIKSVFSSATSALVGIVKTPINWIIDAINVFIRGLNKIKVPDWVPGVGGKGINIKEIKHLEDGALLEKGQTGFLEGNGAEAVVPLDKNKKWISKVAADMDSAFGGSKTADRLDRIIELLMLIIKSGIYLDGDTLVGGIAKRMDTALGQIAVQKARG